MTPPDTEQELLDRARELAGMRIGALAGQIGATLPADPRRTKGSAGQLIELWLGGTAGSLSMPDFPALGVELKTIPINANGRPAESTHVCTATLVPQPGEHFADSCVSRKLARVLWCPVESASAAPLAERRIGFARLWSPDRDQWSRIQADWEELTEMIAFGQVNSITARQGDVLQLRPKGANSRETVAAIGPDGTIMQTNPRAFYLRPDFTSQILKDAA